MGLLKVRNWTFLPRRWFGTFPFVYLVLFGRDLDDEAVGGDGGVGEVGRGLLEQEVGLVVAGADVGE